MRRKLVICASIVSLALSICLFAFSVFAVGHDFSVNNKIIFEGISEYLVFDINAEITGTTKDGDDNLKTSWQYDYSKNSDNTFVWDVPEVLTFNTQGIDPNDAYILYSFNVSNNSIGNRAIKVYIQDPINFDDSALLYEIVGSVGNEKTILCGATGQVTFKIKPKNGEFKGEKAIYFNLIVEEV